MRSQDSPERVASLQRQLRRAGENVSATRRDWLRRLLGLVLIVPVSVLVIVLAVPYRIDLIGFAMATAAAAAIVAATVLPATALYRRVQREQFQRALAALGPEGAAQVLVPLRSDPVGDTRKIAEGLMRDLRLAPAGDLLPAVLSEGAGSEPAASPAASLEA